MSGKTFQVGRRWFFVNYHGSIARPSLWGLRRYSTHNSFLLFWCELSWGVF